jgi:flagellar biosynthesis GTPase FlhF
MRLTIAVYQLSAQFPGPTSPREFITLLVTSDSCLTEASKVGTAVPRHFMVVSIPVNHPDAPPRNGMVRGFYESIEMIREIPLSGADDPETNPVEWIMVTRSDPGGGIPRFMVERNVPSSIVQDAVKFLDWACPNNHVQDEELATKDGALATETTDEPEHRLSMVESNGITAGVGTSIADRPSNSTRRASHRADKEATGASEGLLSQLRDTVDAYVPGYLNPLQRTISSSSSSSSSSIESFASAEQFYAASDGAPIDRVTTPQEGAPIVPDDSPHGRKMQEIEDKKLQLKERLAQAQEKHKLDLANESDKTQKEIEKAAEKHSKERKKQEEKFEKEIRKLEERREKETQKLIARQKKEEEKNQLLQAQRQRDEHKQRVDILEEENKLLKIQIGELQKENTALVARLGRTEIGQDILRAVKEEDMTGRARASSRASKSSVKSGRPKAGSDASSIARVSTDTLKS